MAIPKGDFDSSEALPVVPEEITAEWCSKALGHKVTAVKIVEAMHGTASKTFIEVVYEESEAAAVPPTQLCVKGGFNPQLVQMMPTLKAVYRREAEFFHYIAPTTSMRIPSAWFSGSDTASGQGIVILSDLKATAGCTFGDPLEPWPLERVRAGIEELAKLHASTWGAAPEAFPWLKEGFSLREVILSMCEPAAWDARFKTDARPPRIADYLVADRERIVAAYKTLWKATDPALRCVVHGDTHIGNTFITPDGQPGFLDFQGLHVNSALHDVAYFVVGALTVEDRRAHEESLLDHYLACLVRQGGPEIDRVKAWEEYRMHNLHGFGWALTGPMMQTKERVDAMSLRYCTAIVDHKTLELLESRPEHCRERAGDA